MVQTSRPKRKTDRAVNIAIEGTWDVVIDKVMGVDYYVVITFLDRLQNVVLPGGATR